MSERMASPTESAAESRSALPPTPNRSAEENARDPRVEDYLDHVSAPLIGTVPYARRVELRTELREHLEAFVATHEELGSSRDVAVLMALRQFGPPREVGRMWAREWKQGAATARLQPAWRAMGIGLGSFGLASLMAVAMPFMVNPSPTMGPLSGIAWPILLVGIFPLAAGLMTGLLAPARHALGSFFALALLVLTSAALGLSGWGDSSDPRSLSDAGLGMALVQALGWMPIGCGAAALGGALRGRWTQRPEQWVLQ
jgi:hypothetical protein